MIATPCVTTPDAFQHPLLEDGAPHSDNPGQRADYCRRLERAARLCATCPLFEACLYTSVVDHDVAGVAAGTTEPQRRRIRRLLDVRTATEDLDDLTGVVRGSRIVSHEEVLRLRRANPDASLEAIANWLGCSLSTVKRHLRRARQASGVVVATDVERPSMEAVLQAHATVTGVRSASRVA
ncbi:MAG TPA: WhiB family transcriptional regulator [Propionicimonas sp.]|jgi:DNA-directed RNA polymerase specialized sigma24 family protein|nr:WhiB family transcriptional regulator [Propionicimonas sp.]